MRIPALFTVLLLLVVPGSAHAAGITKREAQATIASEAVRAGVPVTVDHCSRRERWLVVCWTRYELGDGSYDYLRSVAYRHQGRNRVCDLACPGWLDWWAES